MCVLGLLGCRDRAATQPSSTASGTASVPAFARGTATAHASASATAAPDGTGSPDPSADPTATASAEASSSAEPEAPTNVDVKNIGMHIGGGPNDPPTKRPIRAAVKEHTDALTKCLRFADADVKSGTFGVDILIDREGGRAKISNPRTAIDGDGVEPCLVAAFEAIEFPKTSTRKPMMVSYSVKFTVR